MFKCAFVNIIFKFNNFWGFNLCCRRTKFVYKIDEGSDERERGG